MKIHGWFLACALVLAAAPSARANAGYSPPPPPPPSSKQGSDKGAPQAPDAAGEKRELTSRQRAEALYADAYEAVTQGKAALKDGKDKAALKKFKHGLDRSLEAVALDSTYYPAWNLVGFCSRKTGKLADAFPAYARCLALAPDFEVAHEYRGEAYLEAGQPAKAHEELAWLERHASDYRDELKEKVAAYEKDHPAGATAATPAAAPAPEAAADTLKAAPAQPGK